MRQPLSYLFLKAQAIVLLVFGQKRAALFAPKREPGL